MSSTNAAGVDDWVSGVDGEWRDGAWAVDRTVASRFLLAFSRKVTHVLNLGLTFKLHGGIRLYVQEHANEKAPARARISASALWPHQV